MVLQPIIDLYLLSGKPEIQRGKFSGEIGFTDEAISLLKDIRTNMNYCLFELQVDGESLFDDDQLPENGSKIEFTISLPTNSSKRFYESIPALLKQASRISKGELPDEFYLIDHDYIHGKTPLLPELAKLTVLCDLIKSLSKLANYHDGKANSGPLKLVFLKPGNNSSTALELETKVELQMLDLPSPDISLVQGLCLDSAKTNPHYNAQIGVFSVSFTDFIDKTPSQQSSFFYLIEYWGKFLCLYQQNLSTYLSGFAFHKAKKEVADAELGLAEQFSKVISDITGKLLSIPLSLAGVILIAKTTSTMEGILLEVGLILASILVAGAVENQQHRFLSISGAKDLVFNTFKGKRESYPEELKEALQEAVTRLNESETNLRRWLKIFHILSWVPPFVGIAVFVFRNTNWFQTMRYFC